MKLLSMLLYQAPGGEMKSSGRSITTYVLKALPELLHVYLY